MESEKLIKFLKIMAAGSVVWFVIALGYCATIGNIVNEKEFLTISGVSGVVLVFAAIVTVQVDKWIAPPKQNK